MLTGAKDISNEDSNTKNVAVKRSLSVKLSEFTGLLYMLPGMIMMYDSIHFYTMVQLYGPNQLRRVS